MKVLVVYTKRERTPFNEYVSPEMIHLISECLENNGFKASSAIYTPSSIKRKITSFMPDVIFQLAYGYKYRHIYEQQADTTCRLEYLGQKTIGASSLNQRVAQDKLEAASVLACAGIKSPKILFEVSDAQSKLLIMKPRSGACHRDIKVFSSSEVKNNLIIPDGMILQEFCEGREFTVGVIETSQGLKVLPPLEIKYNSKAKKPQYMDSSVCEWKYKSNINDDYGLMPLAARAFASLKLRDYARFDFRISNNEPLLLDANALPNLHPEVSLLPRAASLSGISYSALIKIIVTNALRRP